MAIRIPFLKRKNTKHSKIQSKENLPGHVAIIMDGNGRWAKKRGRPRAAGHKEGMKTIKKVVKKAVELNLNVLTLYAFSTENWKRPKSEIDFIMKLPNEFLDTYLQELIDNNVQVRTIGDFSELPAHTQQAVQTSIDKTAHNDGLILNFALNYGSRNEIVGAVTQIVNDVNKHRLTVDEINEEVISDRLYTKDYNDPDLLIRTSGEVRISNFLLWQIAYAEFYFTDVLWPDFDENEFEKSLIEYQNRKRRYGGI
ncbi:undecaprenyl diphosphate synthase [Salinibacillus kushneri]|uniref:Isoprenyl transferase n=1 Tax=Salinibacillus kushneri TaxID=237682 RepID=A0A1I0E8J6_9BACI|nr:isoprenyl transferase [Salinibacillus kushneri]SET40775.1 undecaprenyl diphosphate synthase [Salinibacillus kushneri]